MNEQTENNEDKGYLVSVVDFNGDQVTREEAVDVLEELLKKLLQGTEEYASDGQFLG